MHVPGSRATRAVARGTKRSKSKKEPDTTFG
jgi:hypothetical protein